MREITVNYLLLDEDEQRLEKITEEYKKQGLDFTSDKMFESIMLTGSKRGKNGKKKRMPYIPPSKKKKNKHKNTQNKGEKSS